MRRLLTVLAIACAGAAGCGGDDDDRPAPEEQVRKAVRDYATAVGSGNAERACSTLTNEAQEQVVEEVTAAFAEPEELSCTDAVRELSADLAQEDKRILINAKAGKVNLRGDSATAEVERLAEPVALRRVGENWRVDRSTLEVER